MRGGERLMFTRTIVKRRRGRAWPDMPLHGGVGSPTFRYAKDWKIAKLQLNKAVPEEKSFPWERMKAWKPCAIARDVTGEAV